MIAMQCAINRISSCLLQVSRDHNLFRGIHETVQFLHGCESASRNSQAFNFRVFNRCSGYAVCISWVCAKLLSINALNRADSASN